MRGHRIFAGLLAAGTLLRAVAMLGYRPALWFNDSYDYVRIGLGPFAHPIRPAGYGIFLWLLKPFHSFGLVVAVQHLLGLAVGVLVYLLLRRRGLPGWGASLAAAPVLLDGNLIELETLILSDTLFLFLLASGLAVLLWRGPSWAAGLLLAAATLTRTIGLPVLLVVLAWLLLRRRWRALGTVAAAGLLPLAAYAVWFHSANDRYALTATDGVFLWARTAAFATCTGVPDDLRYLCPAGEPGERKASSSQVWAPESPIGWTYGEAFDPKVNADAQRFALTTIAHQPLDYLRTAAHDLFARTFAWSHGDHPTRVTAEKYRFPVRAEPFPGWPVLGGGTPSSVATAYDPSAGTEAVRPWSSFLRGYQAVFQVRGPMLAAVLLVPFGVWWRRRRRPEMLAWTVAAVLLAVPPLTVDFDHRYVLTAVPFAALAAGLAFQRPAAPLASRTAE
ncbi:hypothetical protein [Actinocorallia longicatena]|uniref:Dolichyl-phosphate-mannose-protein mannosyltransferase n=1 Tax=Actinocorallia longicatena TaxID=111803 RepID=A0ABP6Q222_9ACTN